MHAAQRGRAARAAQVAVAQVRDGVLRRMRAVRGDSGVALVMVLGVTFVLSALVVATLAYTVTGVDSARRDQDWQAALAAADAGTDDYLSKLNEDSFYWKYGNKSVAYSAASNVTLPTGSNANAAFTGWTDVAGSAGRAQFRYEVDTSGFLSSGLVKLRTTGRVGERTRTVESTIGRRNFIDYLYFTDYEVKDPDLYRSGVDRYNPTDAYKFCDRHLYENRKDYSNTDAGNYGNPGCSVINFVGAGVVSGFSGDTIDGPFHSNDAVYVCGSPKITSKATTSYDGSKTGGRNYVRNTGCSGSNTPSIPVSGNDFVYEAPITLPPSNAELARQVDPSFTDGNPGCLYTGPTQITFKSNGKMDVISPWSIDGGAAWCGVGNDRAMPSRGVIWIRDVPAKSDSYGLASPRNDVSGATCNSSNNPLGFPKRYGSVRDITPYDCRSGDAFVQGAVAGQITVGAANNVVITDDLTYATGSCAASSGCTDVTGLVANNFIEIHHPVGSCNSSGTNCSNLSTAQNNLTVEAAMLSVKHSFRVQNYNQGASQGTLTVRGAIGQRYRGAVGTFGSSSTGYAKQYVYDWRLRYASPPQFLDPVETAYSQKTWSEPTAAYLATAP